MNILKSRKTNIIYLVIIFFIILLICVSLFLLSIFKVIINLRNPKNVFHSIECITKTFYSSFFSDILVDLPNHRNKHKENLNDIFEKNYDTFIKNTYNNSLLNFDIKYSFGKLRFISNFMVDYNNNNTSKKINLNKDLFSISFDNLFNMNKNQLINHIFSQIKNYAKWFNKNFICQFIIDSYNNIFNDNMHSDIDKCGELLFSDNNKDGFVNSYKKDLVNYLTDNDNVQDTIDFIKESGGTFTRKEVKEFLNNDNIIKSFLFNIDLLSNYIKREIQNLLLTDIKSNFVANVMMKQVLENEEVKQHLTQIDKDTLSNLEDEKQTMLATKVRNEREKTKNWLVLTSQEERTLLFKKIDILGIINMYNKLKKRNSPSDKKHNKNVINNILNKLDPERKRAQAAAAQAAAAQAAQTALAAQAAQAAAAQAAAARAQEEKKLREEAEAHAKGTDKRKKAEARARTAKEAREQAVKLAQAAAAQAAAAQAAAAQAAAAQAAAEQAAAEQAATAQATEPELAPLDSDIPRYFIKIKDKKYIKTLKIDNDVFFKRNGIDIKIRKYDIFIFKGKYFDINGYQLELDESLKEIKNIFDLVNKNMVKYIDSIHYNNNIKTTINDIQSNISNNDNSNNENMYNNIIDYLNYYKLFIVIYIILCVVILITFIPYALFPKLKKNKLFNIILNTLYGILILCLIIFNLVLFCAVLYFNNKDVFNKFDINNEVEIPLHTYKEDCTETDKNIILDIENTTFKIDDGGILFTTISIILILFNIYLFSRIFY